MNFKTIWFYSLTLLHNFFSFLEHCACWNKLTFIFFPEGIRTPEILKKLMAVGWHTLWIYFLFDIKSHGGLKKKWRWMQISKWIQEKCNWFFTFIFFPGKWKPIYICSGKYCLIRGVLIQSCSAGAKDFTNYVFCHPQFSDVIQNIENHCAILTPVCLCWLLSKQLIL